MSSPMLVALAITIVSIPAVAQSSVDNDPTQTQVYDDTHEVLRDLQTTLDRMRKARPDAGVSPDGAIAPQEP